MNPEQNGVKEKDEPTIEPYYRNQGKFLVDTLFDLGLLSESLSRDGMNRIEDLVALMFQQHADAASRCSGFVKKYKKAGEDGQRHEEEMRWIARAQEAEGRVAELEVADQNLDLWHKEIVALLRRLAGPPSYCVGVSEALDRAFELGIAEPDLGPGRWIINPTEFCGDPHGPYTKCILLKGHSGSHQNHQDGIGCGGLQVQHREEWG